MNKKKRDMSERMTVYFDVNVIYNVFFLLLKDMTDQPALLYRFISFNRALEVHLKYIFLLNNNTVHNFELSNVSSTRNSGLLSINSQCTIKVKSIKKKSIKKKKSRYKSIK